MTRLKSGPVICQRCVAVLRGRVGRAAVEAQTRGRPPAAPPQQQSVGPDVEDASDPDWGLNPVPEPTEPMDVAEVDSVPCPKCGRSVLFGLPTCDGCGIILVDIWDEEEVIHPLTAAERTRRYLIRAAVVVGLIALVSFAWPERDAEGRWEGILGEVFAGGGAALDEEALGVAIHPTIQRVGGALVIRNDDDFDWLRVEVKLNAGRGGRGGFIRVIPKQLPGHQWEIPLSKFERSDGLSFTPRGVPITRIDIHTTTPDGVAIWSAPDFVDVTEVTILD